MVSMSSTLLLLCGITVALAAESVLIMRHCVRSPYPSLRSGRGAPGFNSPDNYTAQPFPTQWNVSATAACTPRGMHLAAKYGAALKSTLTSLPISIRADNVTRNLQTAAALALGLNVSVADVHPDPALFNPLHAKVCADLSSDEYNAEIRGQMKRVADASSSLHAEFVALPERLRALQSLVGSGVAPELDHLPLNVSGGYLTGGLYVASEGIIETLLLEAGSGIDVAWGALDNANRSKLYTDLLPLRVLYSYLNHGGPKIGARNGGAVLWHALDQLDYHLDFDPAIDPDGTEVLVGHDLTLDGIASLLGMSWDCGEFPAGSTPPMSGLLLTNINQFPLFPVMVHLQAVCSSFEGDRAGELELGTVSIDGVVIGKNGISLSALRARAMPNMDFDCVSPFCMHQEDAVDGKCNEVCAPTKFAFKGITNASHCSSNYGTLDKTQVVLQCPDGVTNLRYCPDTALNVTLRYRHDECLNGPKWCRKVVADKQEMVSHWPEPQCPYLGKPCALSHNCGSDDPDGGIKAVCEHGNVVCGKPENVCTVGPP